MKLVKMTQSMAAERWSLPPGHLHVVRDDIADAWADAGIAELIGDAGEDAVPEFKEFGDPGEDTVPEFKELGDPGDERVPEYKVIGDPDLEEPEAKEPEVRELEAREPEAREPDAREPDARELEARELEAREPEAEGSSPEADPEVTANCGDIGTNDKAEGKVGDPDGAEGRNSSGSRAGKPRGGKAASSGRRK